jgi:hypothetical protein
MTAVAAVIDPIGPTPPRALALLLRIELLSLLPLSAYAALVVTPMTAFFGVATVVSALRGDWIALWGSGSTLFCCLGGSFALYSLWSLILSRLWATAVGTRRGVALAGVAIGLIVAALAVVAQTTLFSENNGAPFVLIPYKVWVLPGPVVAGLHQVMTAVTHRDDLPS